MFSLSLTSGIIGPTNNSFLQQISQKNEVLLLQDLSDITCETHFIFHMVKVLSPFVLCQHHYFKCRRQLQKAENFAAKTTHGINDCVVGGLLRQLYWHLVHIHCSEKSREHLYHTSDLDDKIIQVENLYWCTLYNLQHSIETKVIKPLRIRNVKSMHTIDLLEVIL